jgi:hypothetical protein
MFSFLLLLIGAKLFERMYSGLGTGGSSFRWRERQTWRRECATVIAQIVLITILAVFGELPAKPGRASCEVGHSSLNRSSSGVAQVSNLGLIGIQCRVPRRLYKSGTVQHSLKVDATVYQVSPSGVRSIVPSRVSVSGSGGNSESEYVNFGVDIPVDPSERDAAIRKYLSDLASSAASSPNQKEREQGRLLQKMGPQALTPIFRQHRVGRFQVDCRVLDEGRVIGMGRADLDVLFKGRFFDQDEFRRK